ncbi:rab proteins geranylgeranyltransferase component A 2-like isoform X2 [Mercenaria mercenaria]|uniref:rab proteins geranylgeranyltransferase component A 2-like isoform X2 n=1 Tax=Mercenaria mercenaria TaxID=6596 RepID=UPI00234EBB77|nr:rab proteins geranylgeranyltransferase component A 2-like isoform X2 [Mercenaria mercenaria]
MLNMAMTADLPKEFDVVVLGTGMPESIVAAAFSRIGQTVLHLDKQDHYSGDWASFNLQGIENWAQCHQDVSTDTSTVTDNLVRPSIDESSLLEEGETLIELPLDNTNFSQAQVQYYVEDADEEDEKRTEDKSCDDNATTVSESKDSTDIKSGDHEVKTDPDEAKTGLGQESVSEKQDSGATGNDQMDIERQLEDLKTGDNENKEQAEVNTDAKDKLPDTEHKSEERENISDEKSGDGVTQDEKKAPDLDTVVQKESDKSPEAEKSQNKWTIKRLKAEWRRFNLDLSPKVLYSVGDMVELLISSDIAKYCEFKTITQIVTMMNGNLDKVPCSRADVFSSKKVSMLEKRMLMKFLQFCLQYEDKPEEIGEFLEKPFTDFLAYKKLTPTIKYYIQHSIAMATESMTTKEGLEKMKKFLRSLGRYGNTAFLWSLYGSGELPQSFCRMCAVFGGVYCLRMSASSMVMDAENRCSAVITTEGQKIKCKWLIMEGSYAPASFIDKENNRTISRGIIMTEKPLLTTGQQEQLSLMNLPCPDDGDRPISILELPPSSMAAPLGVYIYHLTRKGKDGVLPKDDLSYAVSTLFSNEGNIDENKPAMLWSLYFTQKDMSEVQASNNIPENVVLMSGPGTEIDIDRPVQEAKEVFKRILPDEEFLPKAPNPEDIIYVDDSEAQVADGNSQSEFSEKDDSEGGSQESKETDQSENSKTVLDQSEKSEPKTEKMDQSESSGTEVVPSEDSLDRTEGCFKAEVDQS